MAPRMFEQLEDYADELSGVRTKQANRNREINLSKREDIFPSRFVRVHASGQISGSCTEDSSGMYLEGDAAGIC